MMSHTARIVWIPSEQGGRQSPPPGPRYSSPARFEAAWDAWPDETWSLVVDLVSRASDSPDWIAEVRFLAAEAPQVLLTDGARFDLYEGAKCVAHGTVLSAPPQRQSPPNGASQPSRAGR